LPASRRRRAAALATALSIAQAVGWATTFTAPAILARPVAAEFDVSLTFGLTGASVFLVALAVASRVLASAYARFGAGPVLVAGSLGVGLALLALAGAQSGWQYMVSWVLAGAAGAAALTTSANTLLTEFAGRDAKRLMVAVMLGSGLAPTFGLPAVA
jgi:MFS family permease